MAQANENVIFIDDKEIKESDMTDQQKYLTRQVQDLMNKRSRLEFELHQVVTSLNVFKKDLVQTTKEVAKEVLKESKPLKEK
tara:strand:- start:718 stop:963 length:246 start_codon:yes stop_codon:yes gene_type:complete